MTKEDLAFIKALRSNGIEVTVPRPPELQEGKPEDQVYSGGLLPEAVVRPKEKSYAQILADAEEAQKANSLNGRNRQQEVENFARDLLSSNNKSTQDKMQEYRDDPTNPLAYTPDADFSSIGYHLDKGNYGDAALYTAFAALPGAAGPVVNKVKKGWKEARGRIKGLGDSIGDVVRDFRKTEDIILDKRIAAQDKAFGSGVDWAERWAYDLDASGQPLREGYLQKIYETEFKNRPNAGYLTDNDVAESASTKAQEMLGFAKGESVPINYEGILPTNSYIEKLKYPEGPMGKSENILATWPNESNAALLKKDPYDFSSSGVDEVIQDYMDRDYYVQGVKTYRENPKPDFETSAVTFRKGPKELNLRSPEKIKATGTHEGHHNQQQILEWMGKLEASIKSSPTLKDSPLAYRIKKAMKLDEGLSPAGDYDWFAQVKELHSELGVARMELADSWVKAGTFKNRNEAINFMQSPEFLKNDDYIKRLYDTLGGKTKNVSSVKVAGKPAKPSPGKHGGKFFKKETPMKDRIDILRGLPVAVPVVGVGAAAAARSEMNTSDNSYKEGGVEELQRGDIEDKVALAPDTGEIFLDQDKGATAKATRTSKAKSKKEERERAKKLGNLRRARSNENVQWLLYNIYKHESDKDAQGNVNLGGFNQSAGDSSAFGSGQFIGDTRNSILEKYGVDAWSENPIEQEMASIALLEMNGLLKDVKKGKFKGNALTERVKVKDKKKPEGFRMDVQNWEAFVDDNKSRLIDKPKEKAETREWKRKLGTYRQNAMYDPYGSFSKIKPEVQSEKADLYKRNYEGIWPTGETVAPQGMPAVDFVMPGDTTNVRQQEVTVSSPKFVPTPEYQGGGGEHDVEYTDLNKYRAAMEAKEDSTYAFKTQKEIFRNFSDPSYTLYQDHLASRSYQDQLASRYEPVKGDDLSTYEKAQNAAYTLSATNPLPFSHHIAGLSQYNGINPTGYLPYTFSHSNRTGIFPMYDEPTANPVYVKPIKKTMATPIMGYEKPPEWVEQNRQIRRMQQYKKPSGSKEGSTAKKIQGVQDLPYKHGGMENFAYMREGGNERPRLNKDDLKFIKALRANGIEVSSTGYKYDSPDRNNPANLIVGDNINGTNLTMEGVPHGVRATGVDTGKTVDMMPGVKSYSFPQDSSVMEVPLKRHGGREIPEYMGGGITNTSETGGNFMTTGEMGTAMDVAAGVGNVTQGLSSLGPDSTGVDDVSGMGGMRQNAVEGTIGATLGSIPIVGQFYKIGAGLSSGFGAGSDALHKKGDTEGGEILSGIEGAINPAEMFGRNAELWEAGYLTDAEAAMSFIGGFSGFGGVSNVGIDRRVREIQGQKHAGALTRATGGMHIGGYPHAEEVNRFPRATGYPKPKLT